MRIKQIASFIGIFHAGHQRLPPGWDALMHKISRRPGHLMKFISCLEKKYPAALAELLSVYKFQGDDTADDCDGFHPAPLTEPKDHKVIPLEPEHLKFYQ
ncbi:MAG: hypothetical protein Q7V05_11435 [Methanoregula sp.]|nr:hypothetical protein [Methanoregula sp.]